MFIQFYTILPHTLSNNCYIDVSTLLVLRTLNSETQSGWWGIQRTLNSGTQHGQVWFRAQGLEVQVRNRQRRRPQRVP